MYKTTLKIDGMMCGMCEAHINDVIRKNVKDAKKVSSSHAKGISTFESETLPDENVLKDAIAKTGYEPKDVSVEEVQKKKWFF